MTPEEDWDDMKERLFGKPPRLWRAILWVFLFLILLLVIFIPLAIWFLYGAAA